MRRTLAWMSMWTAAALCGCASRGNVDLLESQLRRQEDQLYALRRELNSAHTDLAAAKRETEALRTTLADGDASSLALEQAPFFRVESISINNLLTGGLDRDDSPGHDHFAVVISPLDGNGELVKAPGALRLELMDLSRDDADRQIGRWGFSIEEAQKHWKAGFFGSGYALQLPFQQTPRTDRVTLHARLTTPDGRQFDATSAFRIAPAGDLPIARKNALRTASAGRVQLNVESPSLPAPNLVPPQSPEEIPPPAKPREIPVNEPAPEPAPFDESIEDLDSSEIETPVPPPLPDLDDAPKAPAPRMQKTAAQETIWPDEWRALEDDEPKATIVPVSSSAKEESPFEIPDLDRGVRKPVPPRPNEPPAAEEPVGRPRAVRRPVPTSDRWTEFNRPAIR